MGAFVHRTVVEDEHTYAVRIDDGALLDAAEQIDHARAHLDADGQRQIAAILGCEPDKLDRELDTLAARARTRALKVRITSEIRDRARNGRYAFVHDRGQDFAAGIWVVDPAFMIDLVHQELKDDDIRAGAGGGVLRRRASRRRRAARRRRRRRAAPGRKPGPATPRRPAATSASDTTSAPG